MNNPNKNFPQRKKLPHDVPGWLPHSSKYFITINSLPRGKTQLTHRTSTLLESAAFYHQKKRWNIHLFLLMPDHLHAILSFPPDLQLRKTISAWKSYNAKNQGVVWQDNFFEHRLRDENSYQEKYAYIQLNPVRKGLCEKPSDWPHYLDSEQFES